MKEKEKENKRRNWKGKQRGRVRSGVGGGRLIPFKTKASDSDNFPALFSYSSFCFSLHNSFLLFDHPLSLSLHFSRVPFLAHISLQFPSIHSFLHRLTRRLHSESLPVLSPSQFQMANFTASSSAGSSSSSAAALDDSFEDACSICLEPFSTDDPATVWKKSLAFLSFRCLLSHHRFS